LIFLKMSLLYVGDLWLGSTALHRLHALESLVRCEAIDSSVSRHWFIQFCYKVSARLRRHVSFNRLNERILEMTRSRHYDIVWVDKGLSIKKSTLINLKKRSENLKIVFYSPDDMNNPVNQSIHYLRSIPMYDLHVTTKSYNVAELKRMGAQDVYFVGNSFNPALHRPMCLTVQEYANLGAKVCFIGSWEKERFDSILYLVKNGIPVTVWGESWKKFENAYPELTIIPKNAWHDDYANVLNATKINLCFLKKGNRDLQTTRSIEIPACGAFMLAEWTEEHIDLFEPDQEAVFFKSNEELLAKVKYFLAHETKRIEIARAGRERCLTSGYSNEERLSRVLNYINSID
jgi:spore maturation protein CgeB